MVNIREALCSLIMGSPTEEWGELPSPGLMFCQTSKQEISQNNTISNSLRKGNASIMHVGNTILDSPAEAGIDEDCCLLNN